MRFDAIDDIKAYNDPNSCYQPSEQLYTITDVDGTELLHQTKNDVVDYARDDALNTVFKINNAENEDDAFEAAKEYLEQFSAIMEEQL